MISVNMGKYYGRQMWAAKTSRDSYLVETLKPCDFDVH